MRPAILLGLRFGLTSGRQRFVAIVLSSFVGCLALLWCIELPEVSWSQTPGGRSNRLPLTAVAATLALPVGMLIATASRLSSDRRDRRIVTVRLLGLKRRSAQAVAALEVSVPLVLGVVTATVVHAAVTDALAHRLLERGLIVRMPDVSFGFDLFIALVVLASACVANARSVPVSPRVTLQTARRLAPRPPRKLLALIGATGLAVCLFVWAAALTLGTDVPTEWALKAVAFASVCIAVGLVSLTRTIIGVLSQRLRSSDRGVLLLAGARLSADANALARSIAGLVISAFAAVIVVSAFAAWTSTPQYVSTAWAAQHDRTVLGRIDAGKRALVESQVARSGLELTQYLDMVQTSTTESRQVIVMSCRQVRSLVSAPDCRDDRAWSPGSGRPVVLSTRNGDQKFPVHRASSQSQEAMWAAAWLTSETVVLPPTVKPAGLVTQQAAIVRIPKGNEKLWGGATIAGYSGIDWADWPGYRQVQHVRTVMLLLVAAVLMLGSLNTVVASIDLIAERKRRVAALRLAGSPVRPLRIAQFVGVLGPVGISLVSAVFTGALVGQTYLHVGGYPLAVPLSDIGAIVVFLVAMMVTLSLASCVGLGRALTADDLRRE